MAVTQTIWTTTGDTAPRIQTRLPIPPRTATEPNPGTTSNAMMTIRDVADVCQLSDTAVRRAIYEGELQAIKLRSRLRITRTDFDAWIASQRTQAIRAPQRPIAVLQAPPKRDRRRAPDGSFRARIQDAEQAQAL